MIGVLITGETPVPHRVNDIELNQRDRPTWTIVTYCRVSGARRQRPAKWLVNPAHAVNCRSRPYKDPAMSSTLLRQFACLIVACGIAQAASEPFEIKAGDRVVLIGDTWFEREGVAAALESRLYQRWAPRSFSVRNLSFAADRP